MRAFLDAGRADGPPGSPPHHPAASGGVPRPVTRRPRPSPEWQIAVTATREIGEVRVHFGSVVRCTKRFREGNGSTKETLGTPTDCESHAKSPARHHIRGTDGI